jgi:hypothetical protein
MPARPARLLRVGNELDHLQSRCAVLGANGYVTLVGVRMVSCVFWP